MNSPMQKRYEEAKEAAGDALLLIRMGDFYEFFHDDAKTAAAELGLTLIGQVQGNDRVR